jgi:mono/diheme cytochrome c family protein
MTAVDFKVIAVVLVTIGMFTMVANIIPQVQSEVPEALEFTADLTPEELVAAGQNLFNGAGGCTACHAESAGARAPNLLTDYQGTGLIGERCGERVPGMACKAYLYQSLVDPQASPVEGYPPIMPPLRTFTQAQIWAIVAFLESQGGDVTVVASDVQESAPAGGAGAAAAAGAAGAGAAGAAGGPAVAGSDPHEIMRGNLCVACHVLEGEGAPVGPPLDGVGARLSAEEIRNKVLRPGENIAAGYEDFAGIMPPNLGQQMTAAQLEIVVRYLSELR